MRVMITGCAGMIGYHLAWRLAALGHDCFGFDSFVPYYDVRLKRDRAALLAAECGMSVTDLNLCDREKLDAYFTEVRPDVVVNLAAQPGVRQGLEQPFQYVDSNLVGFSTLLDACRRHRPKHLLYASSSSVYGANAGLPWTEDQPAEHPVSLYAATKKSNELVAHSYSHITRLPMTGLRYFTVFGEWGRPDMAPYLFARNIMDGREITLYNGGSMSRDFTYVSDAVEATIRLIDAIPTGEGAPDESPVAPHRVVNIGSGRPIALRDFVALVESATGHSARIRYAERPPGDVIDTYADTRRLRSLTGYVPSTATQSAVNRLVVWLQHYEQRGSKRALTAGFHPAP